MANFRTHLGWGVIIAAVVVVFCAIYAVVTTFSLHAMIFIAIVIGSFLPDLDLDDGMPFQILFGLLGVGAGAVVFFDLYSNNNRDIVTLGIGTLAAFILMRFVVGEVFMRFTNHRGIWHSIPAAILMGLITYHGVHFFDQSGDIFLRVCVSGSVVIGYVGHLILDEIYASVNLSGFSLLPKKSLGSALKLRTRSMNVTMLVYGLIAYLIYLL